MALGAGLVLLVLAGLGIRWIASQRQAPPPRKVMQFTVVNVQPASPPKPSPPPPVAPPKEVEQPQTTRVELKASDIPPPDAPRPSSEPQAPAGGRLALAAEGDGAGDAFNLAGNPGGRGLLSGGGLGDGTGDGLGGADATASRIGWYAARVKEQIENALRGSKVLTAASVRVEVRIWTDASGRISRVQLVRSTGDSRVDEAIQKLVGLPGEAPPGDVPMPLILRVTARRPG
jgi:TonB family protein